ncbi:MAG: glycosyl transferase family 2 [Pseudomonadota bacterium]
MVGQNEEVTLVITSCGRFDLLKATVDSLFAHTDRSFAKTIVTEDSGHEGVHDALTAVEGPLEVIINRPQLGQIKSIDLAYGKVETPYIFHCEDDWIFHRTGFMEESLTLLKAFPELSMISLRARLELNPLVHPAPEEVYESISFFRLDPGLHPEYFGHGFNPGLRRLADYRKVGPYTPIGQEMDISYAFKKAGFHMANLEIPVVSHMGDDRHVDDPFAPKRPTNALEKLGRSISKRTKRVKRWAQGRG